MRTNLINYNNGDLINGIKFIKDCEPHVYKSGKTTRAAIFECPVCTKEFTARVGKVKEGEVKSCGCIIKSYPVGSVVNGFKFIKEAGHETINSKIVRMGIFNCPKCYIDFKFEVTRITRKKEIHCGCEKISHGLSKTLLFGKWRGMKNRCTSVKYKSYHCYGGKGIRVCDEWDNNFKAFYDWAINNGYEKNLTLDRKDNSKNYSPENCRWATWAEQNRNQTTTKLNWDMVSDIRRLSGSTSTKDLANLFWVSEHAIKDVLNNKRWKLETLNTI